MSRFTTLRLPNVLSLVQRSVPNLHVDEPQSPEKVPTALSIPVFL